MMRKTTLAVVCAIGTGLAMSTASADPYIGAKLGYAWIDDVCYQESCSDDDLGAGLFLGYDFTDYFSLEAGYDYLGQYESSFKDGSRFSEHTLSAYTLTPKGSYPINEKLDLFAKAGIAYLDYSDQNDSVFTGGLGAEYQFTKNLAARLEYQYYADLEDNHVEDLSSSFLSVGLTYFFGASEPQPAPAPVMVKEEPVVETVVEPEPEPIVMKQQTALFDVGLFDLNSAELSSAGKNKLQSILNLLLTYPQASADIIGHTDSSGSEAYNQKLSERRAQAVMDYFLESGAKAEQLTAKGMGESSPIASNETLEGRKQNRRVEINTPEFEY